MGFALCHRGKSLVFIEVKKTGQGEGADKQLFEYAFYVGFPWRFSTMARNGTSTCPAARDTTRREGSTSWTFWSAM